MSKEYIGREKKERCVMKSVLISIQPYWVFLIIAKKMGWKIGKEKNIEVRKNCPKGEKWDKKVKIYCSKDKKSFNRIPKEYQPLMELLLGKVIGEFVCNKITYFGNISTDPWCSLLGDVHESHKRLVTKDACLTEKELLKYGGQYAWHISNLVIYDKPRELCEFKKINRECWYADLGLAKRDCPECQNEKCFIQRPPQSWCYVESEVQGE